MSAILDLLYREYCRARLAEMRQQLLIPVASDEIRETNWDSGDSAGPGDRIGDGDDRPATKEAPAVR
ncbi:hypothetical protein ACVJGD_006260 [Bradyrhizobium sp. USDA 10063]